MLCYYINSNFTELSVQSFYGGRNFRLRNRGQDAALPVETFESDEDIEMADMSDEDTFNDPDFRPVNSDGKIVDLWNIFSIK